MSSGALNPSDPPATAGQTGGTSPATIPASDEAPSDATDAARMEFTIAVEAFQDGSYEEALLHFERSYALSRHPELLFNIGVTAERLGRVAEAVQAYEEYLRQAPASAVREVVEARLDGLRGGAPSP